MEHEPDFEMPPIYIQRIPDTGRAVIFCNARDCMNSARWQIVADRFTPHVRLCEVHADDLRKSLDFLARIGKESV